jgi:hypothetical protein
VQMVHPGHNLLTEQMMDLADAPLRIVQKNRAGARFATHLTGD